MDPLDILFFFLIVYLLSIYVYKNLIRPDNNKICTRVSLYQRSGKNLRYKNQCYLYLPH